MKYLYGDATESPLRHNYLELLRATVDFCVSVLEGTEAVLERVAEARRLREEAATELAQLKQLGRQLSTSLGGCEKRATAPVAGRCVSTIRAETLRRLDEARVEVESSLAAAEARIDASIAVERGKNQKHLESLLLEHDLPEAAQWVELSLAEDGYRATLVGVAPFGLSWTMELDIPDDHALAHWVRIDRLVGAISIQVPEEAGWLRKRLKLKTYKLTKEHLVEMSHQGRRTKLSLRTAPAERDNGFELFFDRSGRAVEGLRVSKGSVGEPFEPQPGDAAALAELYAKIDGAAAELMPKRRRLIAARLDGEPLGEHPAPRQLVERLVAQMAPVIEQIEAHGLAPDELVLKRVLADDQRVEIFVSKEDLRTKLAPLSAASRRLFAPLGLYVARPRAGAAEEESALPSLETPSERPSSEDEGEAEELTAVREVPSQPSASQPSAAQSADAGPQTAEPSSPRSSSREMAAPTSFRGDSGRSAPSSSSPLSMSTQNAPPPPPRRPQREGSKPAGEALEEIEEIEIEEEG